MKGPLSKAGRNRAQALICHNFPIHYSMVWYCSSARMGEGEEQEEVTT